MLGSLTAATFGGLQGQGQLSLFNATDAPVALSVGNNNCNTTFCGNVQGDSFTKLGTGTLTLGPARPSRAQ